MNIFDGTKVDLSDASAEDLILKMFYDDLLACPRIKYFMKKSLNMTVSEFDFLEGQAGSYWDQIFDVARRRGYDELLRIYFLPDMKEMNRVVSVITEDSNHLELLSMLIKDFQFPIELYCLYTMRASDANDASDYKYYPYGLIHSLRNDIYDSEFGWSFTREESKFWECALHYCHAFGARKVLFLYGEDMFRGLKDKVKDLG